ncbi:MAG: HNH endonuclease [Paracoccaceae bacterium]
MFVVGAGWVHADEVVEGDPIRNADLHEFTALSIEADTRPQIVHNLEIADAHTHFAGELEAWGHNRKTAKPTKTTREDAKKCATGKDGVQRCEFCGTALTEKFGFPNSLEFDHGTPFSEGGGRGLTNIFCSCRTCNRQKGATDFEDWLTRVFGN